MQPLHTTKLRQLETTANQVRQDIIEMLTEAGSGHTGGSLGMVDVFTALYFHVINHNPKKPEWPLRDRVVLSNGHICPVLYAVMAHAGYFDRKELMTLRKLGSRLQGHPHRGTLPGIENTSGPLGSGLSQAAGMALAARLNNETWRTYCMTSDGEHEEGNHWEAVMFAAKYKLSNLTQIIDRNNIQIEGYTEAVMPLEPLKEKYEAFNWHVLEVDGHNIGAIIAAVAEAQAIFEKPTLIIAHTIPGKGVSFMENKYEWHGKAPTPEEAQMAIKELKEYGRKIRS
ncbi:MAG: transketolase [Candidatus Harrisonbacteria bacterium CG10_big_fil_rev_8_21_14_0_10_45_28]|uniref:Transketolase n=1 Tax=Candidatus Harrisonbacteria bacterium CG10_big_fil_rev_8_21_14_0_10_45_28 TaxID=1974586 RepID=A0A2H0UMV1_9BACT|nr:MAG: transketolase [Candidatus Harrisonbacteria bacterium CG10_big_fil_rev_8_21_14_0_10_45_28]